MIRTFKKTIWNGNNWEVINFYEFKQTYEIIEWLKDHYPKHYSNQWWTTFNTVAMNEKIYIHFLLINNEILEQ